MSTHFPNGIVAGKTPTTIGIPVALTSAAPAALTAAADAPAGGVGVAAGAYDTAAHRDALIALVNQLRADAIAGRTERTAVQADVSALRVKLDEVVDFLAAAGLTKTS